VGLWPTISCPLKSDSPLFSIHRKYLASPYTSLSTLSIVCYHHSADCKSQDSTGRSGILMWAVAISKNGTPRRSSQPGTMRVIPSMTYSTSTGLAWRTRRPSADQSMPPLAQRETGNTGTTLGLRHETSLSSWFYLTVTHSSSSFAEILRPAK
jgi:hypothetical protein